MLTILYTLQTIVTGWWIYLQTLTAHTGELNYMFNGIYGAVYLYGGVVGLRSSFKLGGTRSTVGRALILVSSALIIYAAGQGIWLSYNLILKQEVPYPSLADLFFVLAIPLFGAGFWFILKMYRASITKRLVAELLGMFAMSVGLIVFLIGPPDITSQLDILSRFLNILYPVGDALLVSLAFITFRTGGGKMDRGVLAFVGGMVLQAAADTLFTYKNNAGVYWNGDISDLLYAYSGFLLSFGIIRMIRSFEK